MFHSPEAVLRLVGGGIAALVCLIALYILFADGVLNLSKGNIGVFFHYIAESVVVGGVAFSLVLAEIKPHPILKEKFPVLNDFTGRAIAYILLSFYLAGRHRDSSDFVTYKAKDDKLVPKDFNWEFCDSDPTTSVFLNYIFPFFLLLQGVASLVVAFQFRSVNNPNLSQPMNEMYPAPGSNLPDFTTDNRGGIDQRQPSNIP